jgi:adenine-specific DNA-methyltransferase
LIKYLGSKRRVLPHIVSCVGALPDVRTALDLFSGTARVGHALKRLGLTVHARRWQRKVERLVVELDQLEGAPGWFTEMYCERSRFFRPENGARVDAIRERIAALSLEPELEAIALVSLIEAADRVDSTVGLQMAYLKSWAPRAFQRLTLRVPDLLPGKGSASCLDARACASRRSVDLAYLDPPYNQHSYLGNYHVWESVVRWDKPDVYGVAMKRTDVKERASAFNRKGSIEAAFREVVESVRARYLVVSFNDEGYLGLDTVRSILGARGPLEELAIEHPRYIGHRIGIYNPQGERVGTPGKASNHEHLFVVGASVAERRTLREVARAAS